MKTAILKIECADRPGLIAEITNFVFQNRGNIVNLDQHTDKKFEKFFMRFEWEIENFLIEKKNLKTEFTKFFQQKKIAAQWEIFFSWKKMKAAIFVSKTEHCLFDLLLRVQKNELPIEIAGIFSNHKILQKVAENFGIKFFYVPVPPAEKKLAEKAQLEILQKIGADFVILARYMQILSADFVKNFRNKIINIHHSFLPAFKGANPYRRAHDRGVKIIGATAHFVTKDLDCGPIISQNIAKISHRENVEDLIARGCDTERTTLSAAVKLFAHHRIFVCGGRTIVL